MSFVEMVEMVDILKRADYDGKYGPYTNPNMRKAKIMTKVVKSLRRNFGVLQWILGVSICVKLVQKRGAKTWKILGHQGPRPPPEEGEQSSQPEDVEEGDVVENVTTTGDVQVVVPKSCDFTSDSAWMIHEIVFCSRDLDIIKEKTKGIEQRLKNMIDVLGRI
ncbi:hypothetical protein AB205_0010510 [Aquarana catesbeiana]|uniref:Uncharacterized protein n=1 Tax=Aquarana catesbeiana TaxID=8400 RepID=A0A2G9P301_AQUCT|nr:hypothetical protein AB205_0010510 [Aquarana catesbeiana]